MIILLLLLTALSWGSNMQGAIQSLPVVAIDLRGTNGAVAIVVTNIKDPNLYVQDFIDAAKTPSATRPDTKIFATDGTVHLVDYRGKNEPYDKLKVAGDKSVVFDVRKKDAPTISLGSIAVRHNFTGDGGWYDLGPAGDVQDNLITLRDEAQNLIGVCGGIDFKETTRNFLDEANQLLFAATNSSERYKALDKGASVYAKNAEGKTAFDLQKEKEEKEKVTVESEKKEYISKTRRKTRGQKLAVKTLEKPTERPPEEKSQMRAIITKVTGVLPDITTSIHSIKEAGGIGKFLEEEKLQKEAARKEEQERKAAMEKLPEEQKTLEEELQRETEEKQRQEIEEKRKAEEEKAKKEAEIVRQTEEAEKEKQREEEEQRKKETEEKGVAGEQKRLEEEKQRQEIEEKRKAEEEKAKKEAEIVRQTEEHDIVKKITEALFPSTIIAGVWNFLTAIDPETAYKTKKLKEYGIMGADGEKTMKQWLATVLLNNPDYDQIPNIEQLRKLKTEIGGRS